MLCTEVIVWQNLLGCSENMHFEHIHNMVLVISRNVQANLAFSCDLTQTTTRARLPLIVYSWAALLPDPVTLFGTGDLARCVDYAPEHPL